MVIRELELTHYRNYHQQRFEFSQGINWISGRNGQGKTNLVEAVHYLCNLESFRTRRLSLLIEDSSSQAIIHGAVEQKKVLNKIRILINGRGRQVHLDGSPLSRVSDYVLSFVCLTFTPEDVNLFRDVPGENLY